MTRTPDITFPELHRVGGAQTVVTAVPVVIAIGSNLGDRQLHVRRALHHLMAVTNVVRVSSVYETEPVNSPPGAGSFLNMAVAALCSTTPEALLSELWRIEALLGRRRGATNAPRSIDLDLILFGSLLRSGRLLELPHPRYRQRNFVLQPLLELGLPWVDPSTGSPLEKLRGAGNVAGWGPIYPGHRRSRR